MIEEEEEKEKENKKLKENIIINNKTEIINN